MDELDQLVLRVRRRKGARGARCQMLQRPERTRAIDLVRRRIGQKAFRPVRPVAVHERATFRRSEEHTSELQSLMRISYAVFCLNKKNITNTPIIPTHTNT